MASERLIDIAKVDEWNERICNTQIDVRYRLIANMVGELYPSILRNEIEKIYVRKKELQCFVHNG